METGSIRCGNTTIEYQVRRSQRRRKTVQISMDGSGIQVAAPMVTPAEELQALVRRRAPWILSRASEESVVAAPKGFVSGESLPYLGRNVTMVFTPADVHKPEVRFDHWRFSINVPRDITDAERYESVRRAIVAWYRRRASIRLRDGVKKWLPRVGGGDMPDVLIRDQRQRWGSCGPDGTLRFNWRVMLLPPELIDYVVVHELAHRTLRNHSADYWALITRVMPDAQERRRKLRETGKTLPL